MGAYAYSTSFDLAEFDLATVAISGKISVDNSIASILLNGHSLSFAPTNTSFTSFATFGISAGNQSLLTSGLNTLVFNVVNATGSTGNPQGIRVELTGSGNMIPEPATMSMLALALASALWIRRRFID